MARAARSPSPSRAALLAITLLLAACARSAPPLPADLSRHAPPDRLLPQDRESPDAVLGCEGLAFELAANQQEVGHRERAIEGVRDQNQAVGYAAAVLFPPLWLAAE